MKIPGLTTLRRFTLQPVEGLVNTVILDILKKFFSSSLKSLLTVALAALAAFAGVPAPSDQGSAFVWGLVLVAIRALISAVTQLVQKLPDIIAQAAAAAKAAGKDAGK